MSTHFRPPLLGDERGFIGEAPIEWANRASGYGAYFNDFVTGQDIDTTATVGQWAVLAINTGTGATWAQDFTTGVRGSEAKHDPGTSDTQGSSVSGPGFQVGPVGTAKVVKFGYQSRFRLITSLSQVVANGFNAGAGTTAMLDSAGALVNTAGTPMMGVRVAAAGAAQVFIGNGTTTSTVTVPVARYANGASLALLEQVTFTMKGEMSLTSADAWTVGYINCYWNGILIPNGTRLSTFTASDLAGVDFSAAPGMFVDLEAVNAGATTGSVNYDSVGFWYRRW